MRDGIESRVTAVLDAMLLMGGYSRALVCTEDGLLVASSGDGEVEGDDLAAFTSLFDTVVDRARADLQFHGVDEVTLLDSTRHRLVIRPLTLSGKPRMFLVVRAEKAATWRRNTNQACARLVPLLEPLVHTVEADADARPA